MGNQTQEAIKEVQELLNPTPEPVEETTTVTETSDTTSNEVEPEVEETPNDTTDIVEDTSEDIEDADYFPSDLNALAKDIDVDINDLYNVKINLADGKEPVSLGDLKNNYTEQLRNQQRLEQTIAQQQEQLQGANQTQNNNNQASQAHIEIMGKLSEINRKYQTTDWTELDKEDPGNSALLRQKFNDANNQLQNELYQVQQYETQQKAQVQQQTLSNNAQSVMQMIPDWNDSDVRTKEVEAVETLLKQEGLNDQQIGLVQDPLSIKLLNELVHLRAQVGVIDKSVQQVRKAPKTLRNTARTKTNNNKQTADLVKKAQSATTRTGKKQAELAAAKSILGL